MSSTTRTKMQLRHRSVPSGKRTNPDPPPPTCDTTTLTVSSSSLLAPTRSSKLVEQADALAKMTFELNLRAVCGHAKRLERDLRTLVAKTEQDNDFKNEYQKRLVEMMAEIQSVKTHITTVQGGQQDVTGGFDKLQRETSQFVELFQDEIRGIKGGLSEIFNQLDQCATIDDVRDEIYSASLTDAETRAKTQARLRAMQQDIKPRVEEAINSTRRWNRDHKTTHLPDSQFVANYLKKQSQRDAAMAVLLQRSLQKRIRLRDSRTPGRTWSQPQSLDELCRDVVWQDVIDMVKDVLVVNEQRTMRSLRRASAQ